MLFQISRSMGYVGPVEALLASGSAKAVQGYHADIASVQGLGSLRVFAISAMTSRKRNWRICGWGPISHGLIAHGAGHIVVAAGVWLSRSGRCAYQRALLPRSTSIISYRCPPIRVLSMSRAVDERTTMATVSLSGGKRFEASVDGAQNWTDGST
jgi:hypothetical protein